MQPLACMQVFAQEEDSARKIPIGLRESHRKFGFALACAG